MRLRAPRTEWQRPPLSGRRHRADAGFLWPDTRGFSRGRLSGSGHYKEGGSGGQRRRAFFECGPEARAPRKCRPRYPGNAGPPYPGNAGPGRPGKPPRLENAGSSWVRGPPGPHSMNAAGPKARIPWLRAGGPRTQEMQGGLAQPGVAAASPGSILQMALPHHGCGGGGPGTLPVGSRGGHVSRIESYRLVPAALTTLFRSRRPYHQTFPFRSRRVQRAVCPASVRRSP